MSLPKSDPRYVPEETTRIAKTVFPKSNLAIYLRDELNLIYSDELFADLYPIRGQPAEAPWRLALVTVLQFAEDLSDREAAIAVKRNIDWKYALGLPLEDTGFDASVLVKFRKRLIEGNAEHRLLDAQLEVCKAKGLIKKRGQARTDSTHVLAKVRALNRTGHTIETMRLVLNTLATVEPEWLKAWVPEIWFERYSKRFEEFRLPKGKDKLKAIALEVGKDGFVLLDKLYDSSTPAGLATLPEVEVLRKMWLQQYWFEEGELRQRDAKNLPPTSFLLASPYDPDARLGNKRGEKWTGYKVHVTETCDDDQPHLITHVETGKPNQHDNQRIRSIHSVLASMDLLPTRHLVDAGYMDGELLVASQQNYEISLHGPMPANNTWQAKTEGAYTTEDFSIDWEAEQVTCPQGKHNIWLYQRRDKRNGNPLIYISSAKEDCLACPTRYLCTRYKTKARSLAFKPKERQEALQQARQDQETLAWKTIYQKRSGIEGTLSQGVRAFGMRRSRCFGHSKTHFQHQAIATAVNATRLAVWFEEKPRAKTRVSRFARLAA